MEITDINGYPGVMRTLTSTDAAQALTTAHITNGTCPRSKKARAILVTCAVNDMRIAYDGSTPTTSSGTALGHILIAGASFRVGNPTAVTNFRYVSKTAGSAGILTMTPEFETPVV